MVDPNVANYPRPTQSLIKNTKVIKQETRTGLLIKHEDQPNKDIQMDCGPSNRTSCLSEIDTPVILHEDPFRFRSLNIFLLLIEKIISSTLIEDMSYHNDFFLTEIFLYFKAHTHTGWILSTVEAGSGFADPANYERALISHGWPELQSLGFINPYGHFKHWVQDGMFAL